MDYDKEVEKIRAQSVEQSDLLINAERTKPATFGRRKAELLFLELSFVTTCSASAVQGHKSPGVKIGIV